MKIALSLLLLSFWGLKAPAQTAWLRHFSASDDLYSIQKLPDGYTFLAYNGTQLYETRLGLDGQTLDTLFLGARPDDIIASSDGGFFKAMLESPNIRLQKLDGSGALVWEQLLMDTFPSSDLRLSSLPDGGCYVVCVKELTVLPIIRSTLVRRVAADGALLWERYVDGLSGTGTGVSRHINDVVTMPDSSCIVLTNDIYDGYHGGSHVFQVKPNGTAGYSAGFGAPSGFISGSQVQMAQPAADGGLLALGFKYIASTGGHPGNTLTGFSYQRTPQPNGSVDVQRADYPPTISQIGVKYGPQPVAAVATSHGDMIVVLQQGPAARLWRGSSNLKDSTWERPLTPAGGIFIFKIIRQNRIAYSTPDGGAIVGGVDSAGIFMMKIGQWGEDTAIVYLPVKGQVLEDLDFNCQTAGPFLPAPNVRVRLRSVEYPALRWWEKTDASGRITAMLPPGSWRAEVADSIDVIYGKSCVQDTLLVVADTLPVPDFQISVLRYRALLKGRAGIDYTGNCVFDNNTGLSGLKVKLIRDGHSYWVAADPQGYFSVAVDTGRYEVRLQYAPGMFKGYYCQPTEAYLPDYQAEDSITVMWSQLKNSKIQVLVRRDVNYDCTPANGGENFNNFPVLLKDLATGEEAIWTTDYTGLAERQIYGTGDLLVRFLPDFGDSLICTPIMPHTFNFHAAESNQTRTDSLVAQRPRLQDSVYLCPGVWAYGQMITHDTVLKTTGNYLPHYFPVQTTHHVFVLPSPVTQVYIVDSTLIADSLYTAVFTAANGCDSTVYVHFLTSSTRDIASVQPLNIAPNPTGGMVTLEFPSPDFTRIWVSDPSGKCVRSFDLTPGIKRFSVSLGGLPSGLYVVRAFRQNGACLVGRVVLE